MFSNTVVGSRLARGVTSYPRKLHQYIEGDDMMTFAVIVVSGIVEIQFLILQWWVWILMEVGRAETFD